MKLKSILAVMALMLGLLLGFSISHYQILNITSSYGVSNGLPYCLFCVNVKTSLLKPEVGDYISHPSNEDYSIIHKVVGVNSSHYSLVYHWRNETHVYSIPLNSSVQKIVYTFYLKTTEDFDYAWGEQKKRLEL